MGWALVHVARVPVCAPGLPALCAVSIARIFCLCQYACLQAASLLLAHLSSTSFSSVEQDKNGGGARELKNMKSDRMKVLQMNVCSDEEVAQAVDFVKTTLKDPEEGMWGSSFLWASRIFGVLTESF